MRGILFACCLLAACTPDEHNLGFTAVGSPRWAVAFGSAYDDRALATAIDSIGDVVAVGDEAGTMDAQGLSPTAGFVTKRVASDGSERWTIPMPPLAVHSYVDAMSVAIDSQDSVIVTGSYIGTADFGGQTLSLDEPDPPSHADMFLAKYTWDGHLQWVRGLSPTTNASGLAVAVDSADRIIVTGVFSYGSLTFGGTQYTCDGDQDTYLAVFDPSGALLWGHAFQGAGGPVPGGIAVAANDDIVVAGQFAGPASFGGATLDPAAYQRGYITRFRKDGLFLASQGVGAAGSGESGATQVAVSSSGIVVQTVERDDASTWAYAGIHVIDDSGQETWSAKILDHGDINPEPRALAIAPNGLIVSSAWSDAPSRLAGSMEVVSYDPAGHADTSTFGNRLTPSPLATLTRASAVGATGAVAYTGELAGQVDFGSGPVATHGNGDTDAFIVLVDPPPM